MGDEKLQLVMKQFANKVDQNLTVTIDLVGQICELKQIQFNPPQVDGDKNDLKYLSKINSERTKYLNNILNEMFVL